MTRFLTALVASALVIVCGAVHGFWSDRWQQPVETAAAAARMDALPLEAGDWIGAPLEVKNPQTGGVAGTLYRRYENHRTGDAATVFLVCGRSGPVSIHTPEVCYAADGFVVGAKSKTPLGDNDAAFFSADAVKSKAGSETRLRIFWGWNDGKGWTAPDDARFTYVAYRHSPVLYKLYVQRDLNGPAQASREEPCQSLLKVLLPELDRTLFAPGS
jgi:Protein of unknown function (DUF3485)